MNLTTHETGHEFEERARAIARAIYDPSGLQGAVMFRRREHDGVFIDEKTVVAFEFTQKRDMKKAKDDAEKIRDILLHLSGLPENRYKLVQGFFVTELEPTADQRGAVEAVSRSSGVSIKCMSIVTLRASLIDTRSYIGLRENSPFGSADFRIPGMHDIREEKFIEPNFWNVTSESSVTWDGILQAIQTGKRTVITADFGAGKSRTLKQAFQSLRKLYFKRPAERPFPVHINLRDCYGLKSPREVLMRHADDIGFPQGGSLVSAWRSNACLLLLDGFDELIPSKWVGGAKDLRQVRWQALDPVRRLVRETPQECGIIIAGRPQYFSSPGELLDALGCTDGEIIELQDFSPDQVRQFLSGDLQVIPEWLPTRPLLLRFLIQKKLIGDLGFAATSAAQAWREMLGLIAFRESERISSITPDVIQSLISRVATVARSSEGALGPLAMSDLRRVFRDLCRYEPDEEGVQLLLRLPGLTSVNDESADRSEELRAFIDSAFADAAYGQDLAKYVASPYSDHPLAQGVAWTQGAGSLASEVCAEELVHEGFDPGIASAAIKKRLDDGLYDAVLLDVTHVADAMSARPIPGTSPFFSGLLVDELILSGDDSYVSQATFSECVIEVLDVGDVDDSGRVPTFQNCLIGSLRGWWAIPDEYAGNFTTSEVANYSGAPRTTGGLISLNLDKRDAIGLVILKKVYLQAGHGRRESALVRGLPLADRVLVPEVTASLCASGFLVRSHHRGNDLVLPVREKRGLVMQVLEKPQSFSLANFMEGA